MPNITTIHAITYTNCSYPIKVEIIYFNNNCFYSLFLGTVSKYEEMVFLCRYSSKDRYFCLIFHLFRSFLISRTAILSLDDRKLFLHFLSSLQQQQQHKNTKPYSPLNENEVATHCILGYYTILSMAYFSRIPNMASDSCL